MGLRLNLIGVVQLRARLHKLSVELDDFNPLWRAASRIMVIHERETFETRGFGLWAPLKESTVREKTNRGYPLDPMIRTGSLLEALTDPLQAARVEQGRTSLGTFDSKMFSWGVEVTNERGESYAEFHQGGPEHNMALPIRDVIMVTPQLQASIDSAAEEFVDDAIRRSGLWP